MSITEIAGQVLGIQSTTQETVDANDNIGKVINGVSEVSAAITAGIGWQGAATQEIVRSIEQAVSGTQIVTKSIHEVQVPATTAGEKSNEVLGAADELSTQPDMLEKQGLRASPFFVGTPLFDQ